MSCTKSWMEHHRPFPNLKELAAGLDCIICIILPRDAMEVSVGGKSDRARIYE
jgi:hypothetical protein